MTRFETIAEALTDIRVRAAGTRARVAKLGAAVGRLERQAEKSDRERFIKASVATSSRAAWKSLDEGMSLSIPSVATIERRFSDLEAIKVFAILLAAAFWLVPPVVLFVKIR